MIRNLAASLTQLLPVLPVAVGLACFVTTAQAEVTISDQATRAMKCAKGVCKPKKAKANLNVTDLANMLATGDVKVVSDSAAVDIRFTAPLSWTSTSRLTLDSYHSIIFEQSVSVASTGAVTIATNDGGIAGDFWFTPANHLEFWDLNSSLIINGQTYKLVKTVHALAKAVAKNPSGFYAFAKSYNAKKDGTYAHSPAGVLDGTFEGLGNAISNVSISDPDNGAHVGLIQDIDPGGVVHNASIANITIYAPGSNTLVGGVASSAGDIIHSSVSGSITGGGSTGGLTGFAQGHVWLSHASAKVHSLSGSAGGLIGDAIDAGVERSYATGNVEGDGCCAGGLIGNLYYGGGGVTDSYAAGSVAGADGGNVGGLIGIKSYYAGQTYATGPVVAGQNICSGGFVGSANFTSDSSNFWDVDTSGTDQATCNGQVSDALGLTTAQFKSGLPNGFDPTIWGQNQSINNGYPYLIANPPPQ